MRMRSPPPGAHLARKQARQKGKKGKKRRNKSPPGTSAWKAPSAPASSMNRRYDCHTGFTKYTMSLSAGGKGEKQGRQAEEGEGRRGGKGAVAPAGRVVVWCGGVQGGTRYTRVGRGGSGGSEAAASRQAAARQQPARWRLRKAAPAGASWRQVASSRSPTRGQHRVSESQQVHQQRGPQPADDLQVGVGWERVLAPAGAAPGSPPPACR